MVAADIGDAGAARNRIREGAQTRFEPVGGAFDHRLEGGAISVRCQPDFRGDKLAPF